MFEPYILRFIIGGASEITRHGIFKINYPVNGGVFQRNKYSDFELKPIFSGNIVIDVDITMPGAFDYFIEYETIPAWDPFKEGKSNKVIQL